MKLSNEKAYEMTKTRPWWQTIRIQRPKNASDILGENSDEWIRVCNNS